MWRILIISGGISLNLILIYAILIDDSNSSRRKRVFKDFVAFIHRRNLSCHVSPIIRGRPSSETFYYIISNTSNVCSLPKQCTWRGFLSTQFNNICNDMHAQVSSHVVVMLFTLYYVQYVHILPYKKRMNMKSHKQKSIYLVTLLPWNISGYIINVLPKAVEVFILFR